MPPPGSHAQGRQHGQGPEEGVQENCQEIEGQREEGPGQHCHGHGGHLLPTDQEADEGLLGYGMLKLPNLIVVVFLLVIVLLLLPLIPPSL